MLYIDWRAIGMFKEFDISQRYENRI